MIIPNLHNDAVPLDSARHLNTKLRVPLADWNVASKLNSLFVAAVEFGDAAKEYPIVFVRVGQDENGREQIAPIVVMGLMQEQNLFLQADGQWRGSYIPAVLRCYPFCIGRISAEQFAICIDQSWNGVNQTEGQPLFETDGSFAELLKTMQKHLEMLDGEIQRTRALGYRLQELGLLQDMRFDATLPDGRTHTVDGFLTVDENKMQTLDDATVGQLHRDGTLGFIHAHWMSMGNMRRLLDWYAVRTAPAAEGAPAANA